MVTESIVLKVKWNGCDFWFLSLFFLKSSNPHLLHLPHFLHLFFTSPWSILLHLVLPQRPCLSLLTPPTRPHSTYFSILQSIVYKCLPIIIFLSLLSGQIQIMKRRTRILTDQVTRIRYRRVVMWPVSVEEGVLMFEGCRSRDCRYLDVVSWGLLYIVYTVSSIVVSVCAFLILKLYLSYLCLCVF